MTCDAADAESEDKTDNFVVLVYVQQPLQPATEIEKGNTVLETGVLKLYFDCKLMDGVTVDATRNFAVYLQVSNSEHLDMVRMAIPCSVSNHT